MADFYYFSLWSTARVSVPKTTATLKLKKLGEIFPDSRIVIPQSRSDSDGADLKYESTE